MVSIYPIGGSSVAEYCGALIRGDHRYHRLEEPGRWFGWGAKLLGLNRIVTLDSLSNLMKGLAPSGGVALIGEAGSLQRQAGWRIVFSTPPSVSTLWALAPNRGRQKLEQGQRMAAEISLQTFHDALANGTAANEIRKNRVFLSATFQNRVSHSGNPELRIEAVVFNLALRPGLPAEPLQSKGLFQARREAQQIYRSCLREHCESQLGLVLQRQPDSFRIIGVPTDLCREFSMKVDPASVGALDLKSNKLFSGWDLFESWSTRAEQFQWGPRQAKSLLDYCAKQQKRNTAFLANGHRHEHHARESDGSFSRCSSTHTCSKSNGQQHSR